MILISLILIKTLPLITSNNFVSSREIDKKPRSFFKSIEDLSNKNSSTGKYVFKYATLTWASTNNTTTFSFSANTTTLNTVHNQYFYISFAFSNDKKMVINHVLLMPKTSKQLSK